jgi:hypothetical protein
MNIISKLQGGGVDAGPRIKGGRRTEEDVRAPPSSPDPPSGKKRSLPPAYKFSFAKRLFSFSFGFCRRLPSLTTTLFLPPPHPAYLPPPPPLPLAPRDVAQEAWAFITQHPVVVALRRMSRKKGFRRWIPLLAMCLGFLAQYALVLIPLMVRERGDTKRRTRRSTLHPPRVDVCPGC